MTEFDFAAKYRAGFAVSELGRIRALLPLSEMASAIAIRFPKRSLQGKKPMFSPEGEIALMFLKSYTGLSDDLLTKQISQWNNICHQFRPLILLSAEQEKRLSALKEVCSQQPTADEKRPRKTGAPVSAYSGKPFWNSPR